MNNCLRCGNESAVWQNDFTSEDYGYEQEGIVSVYYCDNCSSEIVVITLEEAVMNNEI